MLKTVRQAWREREEPLLDEAPPFLDFESLLEHRSASKALCELLFLQMQRLQSGFNELQKSRSRVGLRVGAVAGCETLANAKRSFSRCQDWLASQK